MGLREIIAHASDPATVMERVVAEALVLVPAADGAAIALYSEGEPLGFTAAAGGLDGFVGTEVSFDRSLSGLTVQTGIVQHCTDAAHDPRVDAAACKALGISSIGHEQVTTTYGFYLHADMGAAEQAIALVAPPGTTPGRYRAPDPLLAFLESL